MIPSLALCIVATTAMGSAALYATVDACTRRVGCSRVSQPVLLLPRPALTKLLAFTYLSLQSVSLVPDDEHQLVIQDSVAGGMRCGYYGDGSAALFAAVDDSNTHYRLVIHDSVAGDMRCGYHGDGFRGALRSCGRF
jgi:hypothetical protein